jgi:SagB-type dehydrogenase family enzyme
MNDAEPVAVALDELYHCNSKHSPTRLGFVSARLARQRERSVHVLYESAKNKCKTYPCAPRVELPHDRKRLALSLELAIAGRRSIRRFEHEPIRIDELATLLAYSYGTCERRGDVVGRAVPSGGGLYPLDVYVMQCPGGELAEGVYHYHVRGQHLERVAARCDRGRLERASIYPDIIAGAPLLLAVVADMPRSRVKYGERAYRLALLEAGHVSQNLCLVAHALGLGIVALDGFYDDEVHAVLDLDGIAEIALLVFAVGRPRE